MRWYRLCCFTHTTFISLLLNRTENRGTHVKLNLLFWHFFLSHVLFLICVLHIKTVHQNQSIKFCISIYFRAGLWPSVFTLKTPAENNFHRLTNEKKNDVWLLLGPIICLSRFRCLHVSIHCNLPKDINVFWLPSLPLKHRITAVKRTVQIDIIFCIFILHRPDSLWIFATQCVVIFFVSKLLASLYWIHFDTWHLFGHSFVDNYFRRNKKIFSLYLWTTMKNKQTTITTHLRSK